MGRDPRDRLDQLDESDHGDRFGTGDRAGGPYRGKRLVDVVVLALVAVPAAAVGAVCALAVRLTSAGPVLFRQERVGLRGEPFEMLKFRSMRAGENPIFPDADRITAVGRLLRRTSLDELPNLLNVVRGEMSIVGPRPTLRYQVERYDDRQRHRLAVRPGLTGLAQVNGRNALSWPERIELDLEYVDTQSVLVDLRIMAATFGALLSGAGVEGHRTDDPLAAEPTHDRSVDRSVDRAPDTGPGRPGTDPSGTAPGR
jgi:lipopolysaccharide/colanic/teichoic acid biosynthesis glycosyltransferase